MVRGWKPNSTWGFPKGKINKGEPQSECAVREVDEEIGFNISPLLNHDAYVEKSINENRVRLYIIQGVALDTQFVTKTRNEIGGIEWFSIANVIADKSDKKGKFYMVKPFVSHLKKWIGKKSNNLQQCNTSCQSATEFEFETDVEMKAEPPLYDTRQHSHIENKRDRDSLKNQRKCICKGYLYTNLSSQDYLSSKEKSNA